LNVCIGILGISCQ